MQEYEVTAAGKTYQLEPPFFVMATQNPIEQEGTYPLPEAQLDRFMLSINIGYPTRDEERRDRPGHHADAPTHEVQPVLAGPGHPVDPAVGPPGAGQPAHGRLRGRPGPGDPAQGARQPRRSCKNWLTWGAGPRAAQYLILGAKARAILHGRFAVSADDIRHMAYPVLRHRIFTNFNADAEGVDVDQVIERILETVPEPSYGESVAPPKPEKAARAASPASPTPPTPPRPAVKPSPPPRPTPPPTK